MVSGFYFSLGSFTILCASEGSRSFMGGSDVVHCVRVSLTGTTYGTILGALESSLGIGLDKHLHLVTFYVGMGPL